MTEQQDNESPLLGTRGTVLVIESDADVARILEVDLAREGYRVLLSQTTEDGLRLAEQHRVHVVLIDRLLSTSARIESLLELRPIEVIVMTTDPTVEIFVEALDAGAFDLLVKPFSSPKLIAAKVHNAVAKVKAERERDELTLQLAALRGSRDSTSDGLPTRPAVEPGIDPVTGLPDAAGANKRFRQETQRALRYDRPLTLVLISVDELDAVVELAGTDGADRALRDVSYVLGRHIRDVDILARGQGGEFILLLPETDKRHGAVVAERIRAELNESIFTGIGDEPLRLTASFGLAGLPTDSMNADRLQQAAEVALARAVAIGDTVAVFEPT